MHRVDGKHALENGYGSVRVMISSLDVLYSEVLVGCLALHVLQESVVPVLQSPWLHSTLNELALHGASMELQCGPEHNRECLALREASVELQYAECLALHGAFLQQNRECLAHRSAFQRLPQELVELLRFPWLCRKLKAECPAHPSVLLQE